MLLTFPLLSPSAAAGQPLPPHLSVLVVTIHGEPAPDGTEITAWMEGVQVAAATTSGGRAVISIPGTAESTDKAITFRIDGLPAAQEDTWEPGGHIDKNFSISVTSPAPAAPIPAAPAPAPATPAPIIPHLSNLVVAIDGEPAPDGTEITAWMEGVQVAAATTSGGGAVISIPGTAESTGKAITFRIDGLPAAEEDAWEPGGHIDKEFAISIKRPSQLPPHLSKLVVAIDDEPPPDGTEVTAWMEGVQVVAATTRDGVAVISIPGTSRSAGKTISFKIDGIPAPEEDTWERGGHIDKEFAISATSPVLQPGYLTEPVVAIDDRPALDESLVIPVASVTEVEDSTTTPGPATISIPDPPDSLGETTELNTTVIPSDGENAAEPIDSAGKEFAIELKTPQPDEPAEPLSNDASPSIANPSISKPSVFGPVQKSLYVSASGIIAFQALEML